MGQYRSTFASDVEERVDVTANTLTFTLAHAGKTIYAGGSGAQTYTVPPAVDVDFPVGTRIHLVRDANQTLTVAAGAGVTLVNAGSALTARARYSQIVLTKIATNTWRVGGDVTTA